LSDAERERLLATCRASTGRALYPVVVLALATEMRKGEIMNLQWSPPRAPVCCMARSISTRSS
jgi:integrase